jgi:hypothetical protein
MMMSGQRNDAVQMYLQELKRELDREAVVSADEAISDAREFLQAETAAVRKTRIAYSDAELYSRFVERFGSPRVVALAYRDVEASCGRVAPKWCAAISQAPWKRAAAALLIVTGTVGLCLAEYLKEPPKVSPFTEVRYHDNDNDKAEDEDEAEVIVRFQRKLYRLDAIDSIPTKSILQAARDHFGDRWQKRFAEDLAEVFWAMDHKPRRNVRLELRDLKTNIAVTIEKAAMTEANRQKIWFARNGEALIQLALADKPREAPKISPFTEVTYDDKGVIVRFKGERYRLVALDGIPAEKILESARQNFRDRWQKRFAEDLVEVLWAMGHRPDQTVSLQLKDPKSKKTFTVDRAVMTHENRRQVWQARNERGD